MLLGDKIWLYSSVVLSAICFFLIQNIIVPQNTIQLIGTYLLAFVPYFILQQKGKNLKFWHQVLIGLLFRIIVIAPPTLSDDYYRYYLDGSLLVNGSNPYSEIPADLSFTDTGLESEKHDFIIDHLNSPLYYSVYPPILQLIFAFSAFVGRSLLGFVIVFKLLTLLSELAIVFILKKLLRIKGLNTSLAAIYWFNPLIIIELSGNMHGEVFMVLVIGISLLLYYTQIHLLLGLALSMAFLTKLYPLLLIPLFLFPLNVKSFIKTTLGLTVGVMFFALPLIGFEELANIRESINLYFQKFEFNGGIYYLTRAIGYKLTGYNQIAIIGRLLAFLSLVGIAIVYYLRYTRLKTFSIEKSIFLVIIVFYLLSTTVMPWYLSLIIFTSVFIKSKFGIAWSILIVLTYSAFGNAQFNENLKLVGLEYFALAVLAIFELRNFFRDTTAFESN